MQKTVLSDTARENAKHAMVEVGKHITTATIHSTGNVVPAAEEGAALTAMAVGLTLTKAMRLMLIR